ncbi:hypothetical protein [Halalkalicoccus tibetensis]|uniref:Uncharacterized protein n=1 Tax=Halalkalicoccus tibetensis TaxID=175632 RepID=A0ABD5V2B1_9EURY
MTRRGLRYYPIEVARRLRHYAEKRLYGYADRGTLAEAAASILAERAANGFRAGGHFQGVWPRDLCFAAPGLVASGLGDELRVTTEGLVERVAESGTFYTDFHDGFEAATPAEGVDTFPALVVLLDETGGIDPHGDAVAALAEFHRRKFFDPGSGIVDGAGSAWWDSAADPREAYNTAMLLTALERLAERGVETAYAGWGSAIREGLSGLWNGRFFDEARGSSVLACDANVVPLYFGLVGDRRAERIVGALDDLRTEHGLRMRERPFSYGEVHPYFLLHRDYHDGVWPWNSFMYANGLVRYGFDGRAEREVERVERRLRPYGTFLEALAPDGTAYERRGYASAEDFTVAAALWTEYRVRTGRPPDSIAADGAPS